MKRTIFTAGLLAVFGLSACGDADVNTVNDNNDEDANNDVEAADNAANNTGEDGENDEEANEGNNTDEADDQEEDANNGEEVEEDDVSVGSTVDFNGLEVTLNEVRRDEGDGDFIEPEEDFFLIVDVSIENTTEEEANVSTLMQMSLVDPDGYGQEMDIMADTSGSLDGEIGAERTLSGEIAFDVEEAEFFEFIFEDPFQSGQAIWLIEEDEWQ
ncbi:DUF4352 domain-containing protein [Salisediminibacterium halotolerans]|uniref:DUF4352 domain-containing protein n=1 Tax=Salisediminibacterium halotolerans TaxID=517425 RepID=A0A1H9SIK6_9BACI|nr:DUF4352 domain-containing protein [Salisediminibacterium haloalkalitolerans]SER84860.1 protein of unknown function [Salisediminibacterium haloalkalitolerans]